MTQIWKRTLRQFIGRLSLVETEPRNEIIERRVSHGEMAIRACEEIDIDKLKLTPSPIDPDLLLCTGKIMPHLRHKDDLQRVLAVCTPSYPYVRRDAQGNGYGARMLACIYTVSPKYLPRASHYSRSGLIAFSKAHALCVQYAMTKGEDVPQRVRDQYTDNEGKFCPPPRVTGEEWNADSKRLRDHDQLQAWKKSVAKYSRILAAHGEPSELQNRAIDDQNVRNMMRLALAAAVEGGTQIELCIRAGNGMFTEAIAAFRIPLKESENPAMKLVVDQNGIAPAAALDASSPWGDRDTEVVCFPNSKALFDYLAKDPWITHKSKTIGEFITSASDRDPDVRLHALVRQIATLKMSYDPAPEPEDYCREVAPEI